MSPAKALNWRASETRVTSPARVSERCLRNVKFRLYESEAPTSSQVFTLESPEDWERCRPELFLDADLPALAEDTGLSHEDAVLAVIVRDRQLNRFETVRTWCPADLPPDGWRIDLTGFSRAPRLDVAVVATTGAGIAWNAAGSMSRATLLASKVFSIRPPTGPQPFPSRLVTPDEMENQGLDRATPVYVHWRGEDLERPPTELLEIWMNKALEDKFKALSVKKPVPSAHCIGSGLAAQVYADILLPVLLSDDEPSAPDGLLSIVAGLVDERLGVPLTDLRADYRSGPAGRARLMPRCWQLARANQAFADLKF